MSPPDHQAVVRELLRRHGRTFASEAGIRLDPNTPSPLFRLLCLTLLSSARISAGVAMAATHALDDAGWTTPAKLLESSWEARTKVLNRSGYARYDESTARYLAATAKLLVDRYDGDLRNLRDAADHDRDREHELLTDFTGIGDVGATMFLREVQLVWDEVGPFVDDRARSAATALDLPTDADALARLERGDAPFARLVAALVRCDIEGTAGEIRAEAT